MSSRSLALSSVRFRHVPPKNTTKAVVTYATNNNNVTSIEDEEHFITWSPQVREDKQEILMNRILKVKSHQHEHMTTIYAALARMDVYISPDTLKNGVAFFNGEVHSRWCELKSDPHSSGDYKREKFIARLGHTIDLINAARQKDLGVRARAGKLACIEHCKELLQMVVVCAKFRLPVRKISCNSKAKNWPTDSRNDWDTIVGARAVAGNPDLCQITTRTPNKVWVVPSASLAHPNPYGRPIPGVLHLGGADDDGVRILPYDVIRGILWEQGKSDLFQMILFHMRGPARGGRCVLPAHVVKLILAMHMEMITDEVNAPIIARGYEYYPRLADGRRNWTLAQASEDRPKLHDHRDLEDELLNRRYMEEMQMQEMEFSFGEGELPPRKVPRLKGPARVNRAPAATAGAVIAIDLDDDDDDDDDD